MCGVMVPTLIVNVFLFLQHAFLPTMPEDLMTQAAKSMGNVRWYSKYSAQFWEYARNKFSVVLSKRRECKQILGIIIFKLLEILFS